ncbi:P-loop containing nucleoside triphosphate hydrolase protein [Gaertneriomyces semiglobifer]|nr:P-loop containing nucleoside triphosphate hydrolase protein [Gaertneriomyces semiglobifer]
MRSSSYSGHSTQNLSLSTFDPVDKARIVVVGDQGVGKTSLVHLLCQDEVLKHPGKTVGCAVDVKIFINSHTSRSHFLEFIDIGACKSRATRQLFYSNVQGIILVHDVTNRKSYNNLRKWVADVLGSPTFRMPMRPMNSPKSESITPLYDVDVRVTDSPTAASPTIAKPPVPILVVGTKSDLLASSAYQPGWNSLSEDYGGEEIIMVTDYTFLAVVLNSHPNCLVHPGFHKDTSSNNDLLFDAYDSSTHAHTFEYVFSHKLSRRLAHGRDGADGGMWRSVSLSTGAAGGLGAERDRWRR